MSFFVILLVYFLYRNASAWHRWQFSGWIQEWWDIANQRGANVGRVLYLLLPIIGLYWLEYELQTLSWFGRLVALGLDLFVLIQILGDRSLESHFDEYHELLATGQEMEAGERASQELGYDAPSDSEGACAMVWQALARRAFVDFFAILFWYWLGGVAAALAWRLVFVGGFQDAIYSRLRHALSWIPARLAVLGYAIVGHFGSTMPVFMDALGDAHIRSSRLLCDGAKAALAKDCHLSEQQSERPFERLFDLVRATELAWLAAFSMLALAGLNGF